MSKSKNNNDGISLTEFTICLLIVIPLVVGSIIVFHRAWNRTRCVYYAFEKTHDHLTHQGGSRFYGNIRFEIREGATAMEGRAFCEGIEERVVLNKLKPGLW